MKVNPDTQEKIYRILRDYQDGNLNEGCMSRGMLGIPLTNVLDKIVAVLENK